MICPRCSVAEISPETQKCVLCGYSVAGAVIVQHPVADEIQETVQRELDGRFQLQVLLRRESRSILYLARDMAEERLVSLRLLPLQGPVDGDVLQRFEQAAQAASGLRHPHIVPVLKFGLSRSLLWYSMDAMKGRTLSAVLQDAGPMELEPLLELLEQIASGLEYVHRRGVVHGDVKPANILLDAEGWARLGDVGVIHGVARVGAGTAVGWRRLLSARYMAPEQFERRHVGPAADQFALAAVAHECLTGAPIRQFGRRGGGDPEDPPREAPPVVVRRERMRPHVADAVARALADEPGERFKSVLDFVAVLSGGDVGLPGALQAGERPSRAPAVVTIPTRQRRLSWRLLAVMVVVGGAAVAGVFGLRRPRVAGILNASRTTSPPPAAPAADPVPPPASDIADFLPRRPAPRQVPARPAPQPPAGPPARLFVNARPWGAVYVDGELVGNTPRANLTVAAGTHVIRVVRDGYVAFERTVQVASGEELRLTDIVLEPIAP